MGKHHDKKESKKESKVCEVEKITAGDELVVLCETAAGYLLVTVKNWDPISSDTRQFQEAVESNSKFKKLLETRGWVSFGSSDEALKNQLAIADGRATDFLIAFLTENLPSASPISLGVSDPALGRSIQQACSLKATHNSQILEIVRLVRYKIHTLLPTISKANEQIFQVALGHSSSRSILQDDPRRHDKSIQQAVALLEIMDTSINKFAMRVKEWYGWHFPELLKLVSDSATFCKMARTIDNRDNFDFVEKKSELLKIVPDVDVVDQIIEASKHSMGQEMAEIDLSNVRVFAQKVENLFAERQELAFYLAQKMTTVAPNIKTLVGEVMGAKLISQSGSLTNLAKSPSSTVQILGAEKALFRALKTKSKTPKYGMLFQSSIVSKEIQKNKGRMARSLANKISLCARLDAFSTGEGEGEVVDYGQKMLLTLTKRHEKLAMIKT